MIKLRTVDIFKNVAVNYTFVKNHLPLNLLLMPGFQKYEIN